MKEKFKLLSIIIFFGALWGIAEASIGYLLHIIPGLSLYVSGAIMFSFASIILYKAYQKTHSRMSLLYIGIVAAAIKAVDFFLPFTNPFKIINPMLSIIFEALALFAVITMLSREDLKSKATALMIGSLAWRVLFFAYMGTQYLSSGFVYLQTAGQYLEFFVVYALLSAAIALAFVYLDQLLVKRAFKLPRLDIVNPAISFITLALAVILTILF